MAAGLKTAQVNASLVPSTQTNFPSYVDLSRLGITTLAEAQSVRVYADSAKTTEWAREIVSATEMHVKVPSLTSTVQIYADYDGIRADYAVTDTYGRNAVWSDYVMSNRFDNATLNSTGGTGWTNNNSIGTTTGKIGDAVFNDTSSKRLQLIPSYTFTTSSNEHISFWLNAQSFVGYILDILPSANSRRILIYGNTTSIRFFWSGNETDSGPLSTNTWYKIDIVKSGNTCTWYLNGSSLGSNTPGAASYANSPRMALLNTADGTNLALVPANCRIDNFNYKESTSVANWISTKYQNENNESSFWGTWTDAGGATPRGGILLAW
jgi:hypothetical protein